MLRISKEQVARNLAGKIPIADDKTPLQALNILVHGWLKFRKYGKKYRDKLYHRDWFFITEVHDLSEYEGDYLSLSHFYSTFAPSFEKEVRTERREDV